MGLVEYTVLSVLNKGAHLHSHPKSLALQRSDSACQATPMLKDKEIKAEKEAVYIYIYHLGYKRVWEFNYLWEYCTDPVMTMFC